MQDFRRDIDPGQDGHLPGGTHHAGQRAEQPIGEGAGEDHVGVLDRRGQDLALARHDGVDRGSRQQEHQAEECRDDDGDDQPVRDQRRGIFATAGADGAGKSRGKRAAHGGVGHLLHQHQQREDQRQPGQRRRAQAADEMGVDAGRDGDQDDIDDQVRRREPEQGGDDRPFEQQARARCRRRRARRLRCDDSHGILTSWGASCGSRRSGCGTRRRARRT